MLESELPFRPGPVSPIFTAQRFRDSVLQQLISFGTFEALELLKSLKKKLKILPWDYYLNQAEEKVRLVTWAVPNAKDLLKLAEVAEKRLVNNADQLVDVIEEALERIQKKLHAETASVIELWNYNRGQKRRYWPKDENDFSNWLKRQLELEIKTKDIIIAREVEIRRKVNAGERTDIYVAVKKRGDDKKLVAIIEVKGCWHPDVKHAMRTQLVARYLTENDYHHGVSVVGWFACSMWINEDSRKKQVKFRNINSARRFFSRQAKSLCTDKHSVRVVVVDTTLR